MTARLLIFPTHKRNGHQVSTPDAKASTVAAGAALVAAMACRMVAENLEAKYRYEFELAAVSLGCADQDEVIEQYEAMLRALVAKKIE